MVVDLEDINDLARQAYKQYRGFRADVIVGWLFRLLARGFAALEIDRPDLVGTAPLRERSQLRAELTRHLDRLQPAVFPSPTADVEDWSATVETRRTRSRGPARPAPPRPRGDRPRGQGRRGSAPARAPAGPARRGLRADSRRAAPAQEPHARARARAGAGRGGMHGLESLGTLTPGRAREYRRCCGVDDELRPIVRQIADRLPEASARWC